MPRKKKILFISEAAYLNTGYAKYSREVISRIHKTGKYDIAEFSIYANAEDPRRSSIPWKNYANLPDAKDEKQTSLYSSNVSNQFGAWRFERICLDFEPDIVFTIRDFWMDSFIYHSPYRKIFSWAWMPTVDAMPQNQEWIDMFSNAEYILTYSNWAKSTIEKQAGNTVNTIGVASPSAAPCFMPMDRKQIRNEFGIRDDVNIIGTVMRNQRRKLFPILIQSFRKYITDTGSDNTFLYLHTSFPDAGWNLANLLHENEVSSRVLMTYVCEKCKHVEASFFRDGKKVCSNCNNYSSTPSNVGNGVTDEILAKIYNIFDLYIQCANSEGFGLPQVEAAACGIPVTCVNYSAMSDIVYKLNAYPIEYDVYKELETGCDRAVPRMIDMSLTFHKFLMLSDEDKISKRKEIRKLFEENYNWDKTADEWMKIADDCKYADWQQPAKIINPQKIDANQKSNHKFMDQLVNNYSYYEPHKNSFFYRNLLTDLRRGSSKSIWDGFYVSEFSPFSSNKPRPISRNDIVQIFESRLRNYNAWEDIRVNRSKLIDGEEKWLN
jgi:glycosyltransferase involved in cell wall biosynthesis